LINLKIVSATFGIGGGQLPHCPPLATRLGMSHFPFRLHWFARAMLVARRCWRMWIRGAISSSFRGGQVSENFIGWRHRTYPTVVQLFHKWSHILIMHFCPQTRSP